MKSVLMVLAACLSVNSWGATRSTASTSSMTANPVPFNPTLSDTPVYLMPQIGVAAATLRAKEYSTAGDTGLSLGALVDFGRHSLTLETGLILNQLGGKLGDTQINLTYLSIPMAVKWNVLGMQEQTVYLKGGVVPALFVSGEAKSPEGKASSSDMGIKTVDFDLIFGVGGTYPIASNTSLTFDVSYLRGLVKVSDKESGDFRNEGFIFSSGLSFAL